MSDDLWARALARIPGGVNSPVRSFASVGHDPFFVARGDGAYLIATDGTRYIDYVQSWGASILGHAHPAVVEAVQRAAADGTSFGAPTAAEVELAEAVAARVPSVEKLRLVSSGTEAAMTAVRLARGATGRAKIVKFAGGYHGHVDALLVAAGSGVATLGIPGSAGVTDGTVADTLVAPYNDDDALDALFAAHGDDIAALLVEPVAANMGLVSPAPGFLAGLRRRCDTSGALLVFDEVITGFRVGPAGAQGRTGITPDLTIFGKVLGGGLPLAALGGPGPLLDELAPAGPVYQAGTLSGNPLATAAGLAVLARLDAGLYDELERRAQRLQEGLTAAIGAAGLAVQAPRAWTLAGLFFSDVPVTDYETARAADGKRYAQFFQAMLAQGVFLAPSPFEALFPSAAHDDAVIARTVDAAAVAAAEITGSG
ncbi:MAG TPA: glutamate-1-semialdehyde 2,1-aminomutase [Acidimicrobiia bacterium]|nr:glutamate-1-semialdehyde 2,1-aminomutase [Acidimicrobiia bacterium]